MQYGFSVKKSRESSTGIEFISDPKVRIAEIYVEYLNKLKKSDTYCSLSIQIYRREGIRFLIWNIDNFRWSWPKRKSTRRDTLKSKTTVSRSCLRKLKSKKAAMSSFTIILQGANRLISFKKWKWGFNF